MKSYPILLIALVSLFISSCSDSLFDLGQGLQPTSDEILVDAAAFNLQTDTATIDYMNLTMNPDSFLLGTYYNTKYGSTRADIFAEIIAPNYKWRKEFVVDSAKLAMSYYSYFGDSYSPMEIKVYEMTKSFDYSKAYPTNLNPAEYTDVNNTSLFMGKKVCTAKNASYPTTDITGISVKLSDDFVKRFYPDTTITDYYSDTNFRKFFKGVYVTTNFGSATMLNISQLAILYYYHYTYKYVTSFGNDTTITVNNVLTFPTTNDVRQVNKFSHFDRKNLTLDEKYNYISSPANMQAKVVIPLKSIKDSLDKDISTTKKQLINNAIIQVDVADVNADDDTLAMPPPTNLLLVKESAKDRFFSENELASDTCAILGTYTAEKVSTSTRTTTYKYYYKFNVATLIANELKDGVYPENLNMRLIPVKVTYNSSGYVSAVTNQTIMTGVKINSGKNSNPMKLKVVYSGF